MLSHILRMVRCPVGCALPLALFHGIAWNYIYPDAFDVKFQIGMLGITINRLSIDSLPNRWENLLRPFPPLHAWRKAGKNIQIGLATQPSVPGVRPLDRDLASKSSLIQY